MSRLLDRLKQNAIATRDYWLVAAIVAVWGYAILLYLRDFAETRDLYDLVARLSLDSAILISALFLSQWAKWIVTLMLVGGAIDVALESVIGTADWKRPLAAVLLWGVLCSMLWSRHLRQSRSRT